MSNSCNPMDCIAHRTPLSLGFYRQEYWNGLLFPSPLYLPDAKGQTHVSCIGRLILYHWATREDQIISKGCLSETESRLVISNSLQSHGLYSSWNSLGQNTGVDSLSLQSIFPTRGLSPGLLYCMWILYQLSHKGSRKGCLRGKENSEIKKVGRGNSLSELEKMIK